MPKVKTLFVVLLVIAFSFSLLGCGLITSRTASTDEVVEMGGQIPEWLLLSHRSIASEDSDMGDEPTAREEEDDEDVDEDDSVAADPGQTEQATSEVAQAASSGSEGSSQQEPSTQQEPSSSDPVSEWVAKIKPGNPEYNHYMMHRLDRNETPEQFVSRALKAREEAEKAEQQGSMIDWDHSPTGWGQSDSDNNDDD